MGDFLHYPKSPIFNPPKFGISDILTFVLPNCPELVVLESFVKLSQAWYLQAWLSFREDLRITDF